jgi:hypothetical protein
MLRIRRLEDAPKRRLGGLMMRGSAGDVACKMLLVRVGLSSGCMVNESPDMHLFGL